MAKKAARFNERETNYNNQDSQVAYGPIGAEALNKLRGMSNGTPTAEQGEVLAIAKQQAANITKSGKGSLSLLGAEITPAGLIVPDNIDRDTLEDIGEILISFERHIQVLIGDWLISYTALKYGEISQIAAHFGYNAATLYNWQSTCKSVEISLRSEIVAEVPGGKSLGISHYELVQTLPRDEQKQWLIDSRRNGWSVTELRRRLKGGEGASRSAFDSWVKSGVKALASDYEQMQPHERQEIAKQIYDVIKNDL